YGLHDIYEPLDPPHRREIPIYNVRQRCGDAVVRVDPSRIAGIIFTDEPDEISGFKDSDAITTKIGHNVADFLAAEIRSGRIPPSFLPIRSGVGNIATAVLGAIGAHPGIPPFEMFSEVIQDSVIDLMEIDRLLFASGTSLTVSPDRLDDINKN